MRSITHSCPGKNPSLNTVPSGQALSSAFPLSLTLAILIGCGPGVPSAITSSNTKELDIKNIEFTSIKNQVGDTLLGYVSWKNTDTEDRIIVSLSTSCGCIKVPDKDFTLKQTPIPPGGVVHIPLAARNAPSSYMSTQKSPSKANLLLKLDNGTALQWVVTARVIPWIEWEQKDTNIQIVKSSQRSTQKIHFIAATGTPNLPNFLVSGGDSWQCNRDSIAWDSQPTKVREGNNVWLHKGELNFSLRSTTLLNGVDRFNITDSDNGMEKLLEITWSQAQLAHRTPSQILLVKEGGSIPSYRFSVYSEEPCIITCTGQNSRQTDNPMVHVNSFSEGELSKEHAFEVTPNLPFPERFIQGDILFSVQNTRSGFSIPFYLVP